jgi:hypothetical protein
MSDDTITTTDPALATAPEQPALVVPDVSAAKLLAWADEAADDTERHTRLTAALEVESAKDKPRSNVLNLLARELGIGSDDLPEGPGHYVATADFAGMFNHTTVSFKKGAVIDFAAGLELAALGFPVAPGDS